MSFTPRAYDAIVRDLLTTLTGGTVRESLTVPSGNGPIVLDQLSNRPVRRVSHLEGVTLVGQGENQREIPYRFTSADFELVATSGNEEEKDAIRFRENARLPAPESTLTVNYYPVQTDPLPLTDLNVGSVVRTILETVAREMAMSYLQLDHVYKSGFLETATDGALDRVVALVGVTRLPAGHPVVKVRFSRQTGATGRISIPVGTPVTDGAGNRYLTLTALTLEPGESTREVQAGGETTATETVAEGAIDRMEVAIAGVASVANPQPARKLSTPESDDELRRRARGALHTVVRGTVDALRFGLLSIPGVKDATLVEAPNGVPGEIRIDVAYADDNPEVRQQVKTQIDELRPAGIRVIPGEAARRQIGVQVSLTLAGSGLSGAEEQEINEGVETRLADYLGSLPPGDSDGVTKARRAKLLSLALQDERIVDAAVTLQPDGLPATDEFVLPEGEVLEVVQPFTFDPAAYESAAGAAPAVTAQVSATLPLHLVAGVSLAEATEAITLATDAYLAGRSPESPLTVDGYIAALRDETRYALARADVLVTVESADGRFRQLSDGVGNYVPGANETLQAATLDIQAREGAI
jgi:uncharacterized phage protein gp47/JayE